MFFVGGVASVGLVGLFQVNDHDAPRSCYSVRSVGIGVVIKDIVEIPFDIISQVTVRAKTQVEL